ncbi:MAG TPA: ATP-binding protein, partial [Trebonia sp.]
RHAGPATAAVTVRYAADHLAVEVTDTGCGLSSSVAETAFAAFLATGTGAGHGLRGMRERAAAAGGAIEIGPIPDGGFRVAARFPHDADPDADIDADDDAQPETAAHAPPPARDASAGGGQLGGRR